jgi:hypothetical protein
VDDLSSLLLAAIEETEQRADKIHHFDCRKVDVALPQSTRRRENCTCGEPARVRQRCARDRAVVAVERGAREHLAAVLSEAEGDPWASSVVMGAKRSAGTWRQVLVMTAHPYGLTDHQEGEE